MATIPNNTPQTGLSTDQNYSYANPVMTTIPGPNGTQVYAGVPQGLSQQGAAQVNTAVSDLTSTLGNYVTDTGQATADTTQATAYSNEAEAYQSAMAAYGGVGEAYTTVAGTYETAAAQATNNATLEAAAGNIQEYQEALASQQTIGTQEADVAGSGFGQGGTALSLFRQSNRQAALTQALTGLQTNINVAGYQEQALGAQGQSEAATGQAAQATAQQAAVGAQETAAEGAAAASTASATSATTSANFNKALATNSAAEIAQIEAPLAGPTPGSQNYAPPNSNIPSTVNPNQTSALNATASALQAAGVSPPAGANLPAPSTPTAPGSVPVPGVA